MSKIEVNAIEPQCGNTLTLGASGDTVTLASGASQSGFGRTGTVDWDTTPKTASFTAANGEGYFINSAGGSVTVTLPSSPSAGNVVAVSDYNTTAGTNPITIARNGSNINGSANNLNISEDNAAVQLVYVDATTGWQGVITASATDLSSEFIVATGGTITTSGDFKIHTFTGPGTFAVTAGSDTSNNEVSYLVVGGGGAGGTGAEGASSVGSGGGGAGGFRERRAANDSYTVSPLNGATPITVTSQGYPITVGAGAVGRASTPSQSTGDNPNGSPSIFSSIVSAGGGFGVSRNGNVPQVGGPGGSGGGSTFPGTTAGAGNTPPVSPPQGNPGGTGDHKPSPQGGGGGGATYAGADSDGHPAPGPGASGGNGATTHITASPVVYAGGGGGGVGQPGGPGGAGGPGGGGTGGSNANPNGDGTAGTDNRGSGGGGAASGGLMGACVSVKGGNGGSGVVIIRYKFQ